LTNHLGWKLWWRIIVLKISLKLR